MSVKRQKKIKKLRRRYIWPHILMMLVMIVVFFIAFVVIASLVLENMIGTKILSGYELAQKISTILEREDDERIIVKDIYGVRTVHPEITTVCLADKNNEVIKEYGKEVPDFSEEMNYLFSDAQMTIIPERTDLFKIDRDGSIKIDVNAAFPKGVAFNGFAAENGTYEKAAEPWFATKCWFMVPYGDEGNRACINGKISITNYEIFYLVGAFCAVGFIGVLFLIYQIAEIIKIVKDQRRAFKIVYTDFVTGGHNKVFFSEIARKLLKIRYRKQYAVVHLRMEKYRNYCMYYSEAKGEDLLEEIHNVLNKLTVTRREDVSHIEAADFAMLLMYTDEKQLNERLENMIAKLDEIRPGQKMYFSLGVAACEKSSDIMMYYNEAGIARGVIKEEDENRISWFNEDMKAAQIWQRKVENDMSAALINHEFQVYIQPKYSTGNEVLSGGEALIRWIHPTEGFVPPGRFIPIFEKNGFVTRIDDFMITEVSNLQAKWLSEGKQIVPISVNVSRAHFAREDLAEHIAGIVDSFRVPHEYIELELTESAFFDDKDVLLRTVRKMRELGFHVSMDDFGAGYSSLNSLKEMPLDVIKLDAEFFRNAEDIDRANLIVSRTIGLAKQLGMTIVAEGIETREQVDFLTGQDCDLIQGYYFAKPMTINDFEDRAFGTANAEDTEEKK